ncbi:MAG: serine hydrolase [Pseudomonadota bacterium]
MRIVQLIGGLVVFCLLGGALWVGASDVGRITLPTGTGITAKQVCSLHFVSGLEPERARRLYTSPLLGGVDRLVVVETDDNVKEVRASILGLLARQQAVYRDGLGCTLLHGSEEFNRSASVPKREHEPMVLDIAHRDANFNVDALNLAMDEAFTDDGRNTLGVVVLHQGRLVAERYAEGVDEMTPLHGWSMTKSLAATVAGMLTQRGLIDVTLEGQLPSLSAAGRPEITIDDLLRMTGGLAGYELQNGTDPVSDMLFTESDMATFSATREVIAAPGERFDYQSGNTILAGEGLEEHLGETPEQEIASLQDWVFEPLGMANTILEADESGTLQWSSYMYASARDWAKLGQLYLDGGRAPNGTQIVPENWIDYVTEPTPGSGGNYGAGFWLYPLKGLPDDTFVMDGFQGQYGFIIPSEELVIIRLGATNFQHDGSPEFASAVIAAMHEMTQMTDE